MHRVKVKGILSNKNGMNLYRGCSHGCIYCDSRSTCYNMKHDFEDIEVKENSIELLEDALKRKRKKCMIGTGSMTDPYIHLEKSEKLTRRSLEVIHEYGFGVTLITKSASVLDDLDLLKKINEKSKAVVQMTLTTYNEELCKIIEPNVSTTKERFNTLKVLRDNNIPTVVWLTPILPFINDDLNNLKGILKYIVEAEVKGVINFGMGLTLREGNREYFYKKLDDNFKGLKEKYIKTYGLNYNIMSPNEKILTEHFTKTLKENNIMYNPNEVFSYLNHYESKEEGEQLSFF